MNKNISIITAILAVAFGLLLGLTRAEDRNYSYKVGRSKG